MKRKPIFAKAADPSTSYDPKSLPHGFREFTKTPILPGKLLQQIRTQVSGCTEHMDKSLEQPVTTQHIDNDQLSTSIIKIGDLTPTPTDYKGYEVLQYRVINFDHSELKIDL